MKFIERPLSWSAHKAWSQHTNAYILYRLGYLSRMPALHQGIDTHQSIQDYLMGRADIPDELRSLARAIEERGTIIGVEITATDDLLSGRVDLLYELGIIADLKTGRPRDDHRDQLAWYWALLRRSLDLPLAPYGYVLYWDGKKKSIRWETHESLYSHYDDIIRTASDIQADIAMTSVPDTIVVPVHGTSFVDDAHFADITGEVVSLRRETVETERGPVEGLRVWNGEQPIGWIPDSLKTRINEGFCDVFASRGAIQLQKGERHGYVRLSIPKEMVIWTGIAA